MSTAPSLGGGRPDDGFTLIELMLVVFVLGLISTALWTTIATLLLVTPRITATVDDAHGTLQVLSAIGRDAGSTPPNGVDLSTTAPGCTSSDPGTNALQFTWHDGTIVRRIAYRLVDTPNETWIERRTCSGDSLDTLVLGRVAPIARELMSPMDGTRPVQVSITDHVITVVVRRSAGITTFTAKLQTELGKIGGPG